MLITYAFFFNFLSSFDGRTTTLLVVVAFFIQASAIGAQAFLIREYKGIRTALFGNLSLAIGFFLLLFRGILPDFLTIVVGNTLTVVSPGLYYIAISRFTGQQFNKEIVFSVNTFIATLLTYFYFVTNNISARIIIVSLCGAFFVFITAYKLWKVRSAPYRFGNRLTAIPLVAYGTLLVARSVITIISPPNALFTKTPIESANYLLLFILSFLWSIGFILMVSQRLQIDLTELANIDKLTSIPNRHATQIFFEKEISRSRRVENEFTILMIDIDNFKQVNDEYGHDMGDFVLIKAAQIFQSAIRKQDIVGRWGGEEFLIILPDTTINNAEIFATRLRNKISTAEFEYSNISVKMTISIGIASSNSVETMDVLLRKADLALYKAKVIRNSIAVA